MVLKNVVLVVLLVVNVVQARPRDSTVVLDRDITVQSAESLNVPKAETTTPNEGPGVLIPGRISCQYEEATEDAVCLEHCGPKGYSYGICVSKTCSCI